MAAGTGALVFTGVNDWPGLHVSELALPSLPAYDTVRIADLAWCIPLAVGVAVAVVAARHLAHGLGTRAARRPDLALVVAGLFVGLLAVVFRTWADRPVDLVLFSGQQQLPDIVSEESASVLALLVLAKGLAYAISLGSGFRGGPVFPAIVVGVAIGGARGGHPPGARDDPGNRHGDRGRHRFRDARAVHRGAARDACSGPRPRKSHPSPCSPRRSVGSSRRPSRTRRIAASRRRTRRRPQPDRHR